MYYSNIIIAKVFKPEISNIIITKVFKPEMLMCRCHVVVNLPNVCILDIRYDLLSAFQLGNISHIATQNFKRSTVA